MHSRTSHRTDKSHRRGFNATAPQRLARSGLEEAPPTPYRIWDDGTLQAAAIAMAVTVLFFMPSRVAAQPSATPAEILERVAQTQKVKAELEAQIRELRGQLDAEIYKLKSWSALNAVGRIVAWPMTATRVDMGFFAHDIVAETAIAGVEVRCQLPATEENKQLKVQYPRGTQFTCVGRIGNIMSLAHPMTIILNDAKVTGAGRTLATTSNKLPIEPVLNTQKVPIEHARKAVELFQMACLPLFTTHAADIVEVKATVHDGWSQRAQAWGWGAEIWIEVVLSDRTQTFPDARASGHHLWYFLGGGTKAGFQAQKRVSQTACGLPTRDDEPDAFVSLPGLAAVLPSAP